MNILFPCNTQPARRARAPNTHLLCGVLVAAAREHGNNGPGLALSAGNQSPTLNQFSAHFRPEHSGPAATNNRPASNDDARRGAGSNGGRFGRKATRGAAGFFHTIKIKIT